MAMNTKFASKGLNLLIGLTLITMLLVPPLYLQATVMDTYKVPQELLIVALGWILIGLTSIQRAIAGRPVWTGGQGAWTRWLLLAFLTWAFLANAFGYGPALPWRFGMTVATYLLVGQSLLDWLQERIER